jgi:S1-C subfamily serine protease
VRPAIPGFGVGHLDVTVGTLGCLVTVKGDKKGLYILSNSHILANEGVANKGDIIIQPGRYDGGNAPNDVIAKLFEWVQFQFTPSGFPNLVDAAIAKVNKKKDVVSAIYKIGIPKGVSTFVRRGMRVQKTGRTTDYTIGEIRDVDYRLALNYKIPSGGSGRVGLSDQVLCTRYTAGGDSGSAVLNMSGKVVGLHFAGSPSSSIFNKINNVLDLLSIAIVTKKI